MINNGYIDEVYFWQYDDNTLEYARSGSKRVMTFKEFLDLLERLKAQYDVIKWQIDSMDPDYTLACVYMR
jgi:hypothetical protein